MVFIELVVTKGVFPELVPYMLFNDLQTIPAILSVFWLNHLYLQVKSAQLVLVTLLKRQIKLFKCEGAASAAATPWAHLAEKSFITEHWRQNNVEI